MSTILAIDPGTTESAFLQFNPHQGILARGIVSNASLLSMLCAREHQSDTCAIEMIASYGMAVGKEVFNTVLWIGRFYERAAEMMPVRLVYRKDIKLDLCGSARAKDGNIRQALIDIYGAPGTKKLPGGTYGISSHLWSALAVAHYASKTQ